jgi:hypothetical protein
MITADELCPVPDQLLAEIYRASPHGLNELVATVEPDVRALLALYCYRRAHLETISLAIAATCEEDDLTALGGNAGAALFARSREAAPLRLSLAEVSTRGRKVSLSIGPLCSVSVAAEQED